MSWKYKAEKKEIGPIDVFITYEDKPAKILQNHGYHSPDGFQMGYAGSGPADLAYSILADYMIEIAMPTGVISLTEIKHKVEILHQQFKNDFIVDAKEILEIDSELIGQWIEKQKEKINKVLEF